MINVYYYNIERVGALFGLRVVIEMKLSKIQRESLKRWAKEFSTPKEVKKQFERIFGPIPVTEGGRFSSLLSYYMKPKSQTTEAKLKAEISRSYADKTKRIRLRRILVEELRDLVKEANDDDRVKGTKLALVYYQELRNQLNDLQVEIEGRTPVSVTQVFSGKEAEEKGVLESGEFKERAERLLKRAKEIEESKESKGRGQLDREKEEAVKVVSEGRKSLEEILDGEEEGDEGKTKV